MSAVLTITKVGENKIRFTFESRRRKPFASPTQAVWEVPVERSALLNFCQEMNHAAELANKNTGASDSAISPFMRAGRGLFCELLPKADPRIRELLAKLRKLKSPLLISTDEPNLFWELLFDEEQEEFFGLKHRLGRRLMTQEVPTNVLRDRKDWRCLMIADPTGNLPQTAREAAQLRDWLEGKQFKEIDYLSGSKADYDSVLAALSSKQYDIIHYAGHTILDPETGEYALELHKEKPFRASLIRKHLNGNPIVFLNGCWTGYAKGLGNVPGSVVGLTDAFLAAGAQVVVGSQFKVPDAGARAFAEKFYQSLLEGECVGEAMRLARLHVQKAPGCGAAWACFVLYGDPAVELKLRDDVLGKLLGTIELKRENLEESSLCVVQQALDYSGKSGIVATIELFAALVDSDSGFLRNGLEQQDIAVGKLARAFKSALEKMNASGTSLRGGVRFSGNTGQILHDAQAIAQADGKQKISERDLVQAFVQKKGGTTGKTLREIGVDFERLLKWVLDAVGHKPPPVERYGTKSPNPESGGRRNLLPPKGEFTKEALQVLSRAAELAGHSERPLLGTPELFFGLQQNPKGPLASAIRRLHLSQLAHRFFGKNGENNSSAGSVSAPGKIPLSNNVRAILEAARNRATEANRAEITERDLLYAFVGIGGGALGKFLREDLKLMPEALASELFLPSNDFDLTRFAPALHSALKQARELASEKGDKRVRRLHLFCAMLAEGQSLLAETLRAQGKNAALLSDLLYTALPTDTKAGLMGEKALPMAIAISLVNVLTVAEIAMQKHKQREMSEPLLLLSLLTHSNDIGAFLTREQVHWRNLIKVVETRLKPGGPQT